MILITDFIWRYMNISLIFYAVEIIQALGNAAMLFDRQTLAAIYLDLFSS